jgi:hypothetical protein
VKGLEKLWCTVAPCLPYDPDPFQLKCTAQMLNGQDIPCLSATGSGKLALLYLVSIAHKGTIALVVCPTNFLESDLVYCYRVYIFLITHRCIFCRSPACRRRVLSAHAINSETLTAAVLGGCDIWAKAVTGRYQILLFSPETTATNEFDTLINHESVRLHISYFVIDKIHLVHKWGPKFRPLYSTLATMRG